MSDAARQQHWENVYATKGEQEVSWFEQNPSLSLALIKEAGFGSEAVVIDIGGGASHLVDALLTDSQARITVLDLSANALEVARARLSKSAVRVNWVVSDVTAWKPDRAYDVWHDRAAFHFLTEAADQSAYVAVLRAALKPGGVAIIGTFALDGPEKCSGLPVARHDEHSLANILGADFELLSSQRHEHQTPWAAVQRFQFSSFRRLQRAWSSPYGLRQ
jgi:2-polyprenyl-3-methyl-5-hydroxy-6-metoxy-1,4-benzoquinol methylase